MACLLKGASVLAATWGWKAMIGRHAILERNWLRVYFNCGRDYVRVEQGINCAVCNKYLYSRYISNIMLTFISLMY